MIIFSAVPLNGLKNESIFQFYLSIKIFGWRYGSVTVHRWILNELYVNTAKYLVWKVPGRFSSFRAIKQHGNGKKKDWFSKKNLFQLKIEIVNNWNWRAANATSCTPFLLSSFYYLSFGHSKCLMEQIHICFSNKKLESVFHSNGSSLLPSFYVF